MPQLLPLLREVSRSFYLSIRVLPAGLREPIALAYLLARATDTVADTSAVPLDERRDLLGRLDQAIARGATPVIDVSGFIAAQRHAGERELMQRLGECLVALNGLEPADQVDVRVVLRHIVRGQTLDLERPVLPDAAALRDYTYLVAGSVGEFWTDMCERHVPDFATRDAQQMRALGRSFGCALQLVNILRDAGEDERAGRRYLPPDGGDWVGEAARGLADGMAYAQAVNSRRIRVAVALPALLGQRTLALLRDAGAQARHTRVKVPRAEVYWMLARIALGLAGRGTLQSEWDNLRR